MQRLRREDLSKVPAELLNRNHKVCDDHFENSQFMNKSTSNRLIHNAVPTPKNIPNPPPSVDSKRQPPKQRQAPQKKVAVTPVCATPVRIKVPITPEKLKLKTKIKRLQTKLWRAKQPKLLKTNQDLSSSLNTLKQYLPKRTMDFISTQVQMSKRSPKGLRWSPKDKMFAISIFYHSRKAYEIMGDMFRLPSARTLQRTLQNSNIFPGFSDKILFNLRKKVQGLHEKEKQCVLVFDEMSIKQCVNYNKQFEEIEGFENFGINGKTKFVANHALVFIVRGIYSKWKQPLGYFLSSGTVENKMLDILVKQCIAKVTSVGLNVKLLVCDQGSNRRFLM